MKGSPSLIITILAVILTAWWPIVSTAHQLPDEQSFKVVVDAGHGDHDYGAIGAITNEKKINLAVALELQRLLNNAEGFEVVMTRDDDSFVTLGNRAIIANKCSGDLFVSIHTNSVDKKSKNRTTVCGASVYTMGLSRSDENLAVAMRENSVLTLEPDFSTEYQGFDPNSAESYIIFEMDHNLHLEQSISVANHIQTHLVSDANRKDRGVRQAPFSVLRNTAMPAVLVELDFICNPTVEKYLNSEKGQKQLARAIYNGLEEYRYEVLRANALRDGKTPPPQPTPIAEPADNLNLAINDDVEENMSNDAHSGEGTRFKVQFFTSPSVLPENSPKLKELEDVDHYTHNGLVKYTAGNFDTRDKAAKYLAKVKKRYSDAFIIETLDGVRVN